MRALGRIARSLAMTVAALTVARIVLVFAADREHAHDALQRTGPARG